MKRGCSSSRFRRMHPALTCQHVQRNDILKTHKIDLVPGHRCHSAPELNLTDMLDQDIYTGPNPRLDLD